MHWHCPAAALSNAWLCIALRQSAEPMILQRVAAQVQATEASYYAWVKGFTHHRQTSATTIRTEKCLTGSGKAHLAVSCRGYHLILLLVQERYAEVAGNLSSQLACTRWQLVQRHPQLAHSRGIFALPREDVAQICPVLCNLCKKLQTKTCSSSVPVDSRTPDLALGDWCAACPTTRRGLLPKSTAL